MNAKKIQKTISQKFDNCTNATLFAEPFDLLGGIGVYYKLNIKKVTLKCDKTNKIIAKKYWNEQTKNTAQELKEQLKITKGGWYFMAILALVSLFLGLYAINQGKIQTKAYQLNYISKTREEKQILRANLNKDDLVRTLNNIYKIVKVEDETIVVIKSTIKPTSNVNKPIDSDKFKDDTFVNDKIIIDKLLFIKYSMVTEKLENKDGENVFQILNRE